ncbi:hypothetical protein DICPUDRAFT_99859 [Dictyostelium purpureum]|uniref:IPT/TIG domain-containing protein n=1 Tax=Dictyostelium purpureum TaxID=5786 RepID=F1A371_DICPU|nr:uncharacterized protein DICPUDRAFT_99859 [Dictyostelium purpureum]EGC29361.1 hypothetical protein DICPUDRAFT_99859 [Dictyostelium purpureum]|eukprot:XP_003294115.1 hypothetical protein DICPUDRAFT_99859 [Dictyostelium purpureum]
MSKNIDSSSCNSTFDLTGYTDFQSQSCNGTQLFMISNKIGDKVSIPLQFPVLVDSHELNVNGSSVLKLRYYNPKTTGIIVKDILGQFKKARNVQYVNNHIYGIPGTLTWDMDPGFGYVNIQFGGQVENIYKATYPKPYINSSRVVSVDPEKGMTQIEFIGANFGNNKRLITFLPNCYPFPYKINIDYVNSTYLLISDYNAITELCPSRDFRYSICIDNLCNSGSLREGYPPITINSVEGPSANRTYQFNGYFLNSTTFSQLTPQSQYGQRISTSFYEIEFQMNSPSYYQYNGSRAFKFWDKNANTSISIAVNGFEAGPPVIKNAIESEDKIQVNGDFFVYDMDFFMDGNKVDAHSIQVENSTMFFIQPKPRPGTLTIQSPVKDANSSTIVRIKPTIKSITSAPTKGGIVTIFGSGLYLVNSNGKNLKVSFAIEQFNSKVKSTCSEANEFSGTSNAPINPGVAITCKVPAGIGRDLKFTITIEGQSATYSQFSYSKPIITSIQQTSDKAIVIGDHFGEKQRVTIHVDQVSIPVQTLNSNRVEFKIPDSAKTTNIYLDVANQVSNSQLLYIVPFITRASGPISVNGGTLELYGKYLNLENYNNNPNNTNNLKIKIGKKYCKDVKQLDLVHFSSITCKVGSGSGHNFPIQIEIDNNKVDGNPNNILFSYFPPIITNSTSISPNGGLITVFGHELARPINVTIDSRACIYINVTDSESLTCYLPPLDEQLTASSMKSIHPVSVNVNGQNGGADVFKYTVPEKYTYKSEDDPQERKKRLKWLVPAILIPSIVGLLTLIALITILMKKYKRRKQIQRRLNDNSRLPE